MKGGTEGGYYKGREVVIGGREKEKGREGRKEVWRVKRKKGVGRVLQREGGCSKREEGVVGGSGREKEGIEGRKGVWTVRRREGVREGITKAGREGWG